MQIAPVYVVFPMPIAFTSFSLCESRLFTSFSLCESRLCRSFSRCESRLCRSFSLCGSLLFGPRSCATCRLHTDPPPCVSRPERGGGSPGPHPHRFGPGVFQTEGFSLCAPPVPPVGRSQHRPMRISLCAAYPPCYASPRRTSHVSPRRIALQTAGTDVRVWAYCFVLPGHGPRALAAAVGRGAGPRGAGQGRSRAHGRRSRGSRGRVTWVPGRRQHRVRYETLDPRP
eukprot:2645973-Rhodomonas_salina.2